MTFWDKNPCGGHYDEEICNKFQWYFEAEPWLKKEFLKRGEATNLEVGIGQGFLFVNNLKTWNKKITGIDISSESIREAKKNLKYFNLKANVTKMDAENLKFPANDFDFVYSVGVIHHTKNTQKAFNEIIRVSKKKFYVMIYSKNNPKAFVVRIIRALNRMFSKMTRKKGLYSLLSKENKEAGTAWLELFGVPYMRMYNASDIKSLIRKASKNTGKKIHYRTRTIEPGFRRFFQMSGLGFMMPFGSWIDKKTYNFWGFYRIIEGNIKEN